MITKKNNTITKIIPIIKPLGDKVLVKLNSSDEVKNSSGIIIPDTISKDKPEEGKIVAIGDGRMTDDGNVVPMRVKIGDTIVFSKYGPDEIKVNGEDYYVISESNILAIIA